MSRLSRCIAPALAALAMLSIVSCDAPVYDRRAILEDAVSVVILPGYERLAHETRALQDDVTSLCAAPNAAGVAAAQAQWVVALEAFEQTSATQIGPARTMNLSSEMGFWPVSPTAIERNVAGTDAIDAHYVDALGAGSKGFFAVAYVLFGGTPDAAWSAPGTDAIAATLATTPRRCVYLTALADHVARTSEALASAWRPGEGDYAHTLTSAGAPGNPDYPDVATALVALLGQMLETLKTTKNTKLGIPIGHRSAMASPMAVQSPFASISVRAMRADVQGVRDLWSLAPRSFDAWLRTRDAALADTVRGELDAADAALSALEVVAEPESGSTTFAAYCAGADRSVGESTYTRIDAAEMSIAVDVAGQLGLSVAFSDMDGD